MRFALIPLALLAIAACGRKNGGDQAQPSQPEIEVREVAAADGYGAPGVNVTAVAFWSHPTINFQSEVLAGTDAGIVAYAVETGDVVASVDDGAVSGLAILYFGAGPSAQAYAIAKKAAGYAAYAIDNISGGLTPIAVKGGDSSANGFCAGNDGASRVLYEIAANGVARRTIDESMTIGEATALAAIPGAIACEVDNRNGDVFVISGDGSIRRIDPANGESSGVAFASGAVDAFGLMLMTSAAAENTAGGALLVLDASKGVISAYDIIDGHAIGAFRIKSTFDLDAVASAKTIGAGFGNYGGVYRDGAIAVVTSGDGPSIRLAPWNGVLDALNVTLGENVDPRSPQGAKDDEDVLSIELMQP